VLHRTLGSLDSIAVLGAGGPLDAIEASIANRLAGESQATIHFIHVVKERASEAHVQSVERYHQQLGALCSVETRSTVLRSGRPLTELEHATSNASLTILGASSSQFLASRFGEGYANTLAKTLTSPVLLVHSQDAARRSFLGVLLERLVY
jgi:nucleotide-binding universal stress UspA family protein